MLKSINLTRRRWPALAVGTAAAIFSHARPAHALFGVGDVIFDPANFAQHLLILEQHAQQLLQLKQQVEQMDAMLKGWDFSRLDETLAQMERIHDALDEIGTSMGDLATRFPSDWSAGNPHDADATINPRQRQWRGEQRVRAEQTVRLHQAVAEGMAETRGRVAEYVQKSNAAPGQLAAQQATNELLAVQVQQLQEMQALEIAALRTELEKQAGKVSAAEWEDAHLRGDQNATTTEQGRVANSPGPTGGNATTPADTPSITQHRSALPGN